mmetsp:Transcript_5579/g.10027  ORF Transcript_5579/g.10027 Transcript_5579/m.10027 type:complete len:335 (-) Transcript_5579:43-1047(-)
MAASTIVVGLSAASVAPVGRRSASLSSRNAVRAQASPFLNTHRALGSSSSTAARGASLRKPAPCHRGRRSAVRTLALRNVDEPEALLFDCDGVLVDTEKDGHRVSFNKAFEMKGIGHEWDVELYGKLLEIGGGKERMLHFFTSCEDQEPFKSIQGEEARWELCKELHVLKTQLFMELVETGAMPLRPGVSRLINEAINNGVKVAVCSTSNEKAVSTIVRVMLGPKVFEAMPVFAGDMVPRKKPDPAIYTMAAEKLEVDPARCVVIEDSRIGLLAAKAAGMRCVITESSYTAGEDFDIADVVFDCIGEKNEERFSLIDLTTPGMQTLAASRYARR